MSSSSSAPVPKIEAKDDDVVFDEASVDAPMKTEISGAGIRVTKTGKKRGTIFKCESCSKASTLHFIDRDYIPPPMSMYRGACYRRENKAI